MFYCIGGGGGGGGGVAAGQLESLLAKIAEGVAFDFAQRVDTYTKELQLTRATVGSSGGSAAVARAHLVCESLALTYEQVGCLELSASCYAELAENLLLHRPLADEGPGDAAHPMIATEFTELKSGSRPSASSDPASTGGGLAGWWGNPVRELAGSGAEEAGAAVGASLLAGLGGAGLLGTVDVDGCRRAVKGLVAGHVRLSQYLFARRLDLLLRYPPPRPNPARAPPHCSTCGRSHRPPTPDPHAQRYLTLRCAGMQAGPASGGGAACTGLGGRSRRPASRRRDWPRRRRRRPACQRAR